MLKGTKITPNPELSEALKARRYAAAPVGKTAMAEVGPCTLHVRLADFQDLGGSTHSSRVDIFLGWEDASHTPHEPRGLQESLHALPV